MGVNMIYDILFIFSFGFVGGSISLMFDAFMEKGMIFHGYYKWLLKFANVKMNGSGEILSSSPIFKIMGGCVLCTNFYITFIAYLCGCLYFELNTLQCFLFFIPTQALSFITVKKLM